METYAPTIEPVVEIIDGVEVEVSAVVTEVPTTAPTVYMGNSCTGRCGMLAPDNSCICLNLHLLILPVRSIVHLLQGWLFGIAHLYQSYLNI